jgi:hypothetical protein
LIPHQEVQESSQDPNSRKLDDVVPELAEALRGMRSLISGTAADQGLKIKELLHEMEVRFEDSLDERFGDVVRQVNRIPTSYTLVPNRPLSEEGSDGVSALHYPHRYNSTTRSIGLELGSVSYTGASHSRAGDGPGPETSITGGAIARQSGPDAADEGDIMSWMVIFLGTPLIKPWER